MTSIATIILTFNEELHLERAIASVSPFSHEIFVIDSYSEDATLDIARSWGATVLQNKFVNQAQQFQWALDNAPITSEWILRLDADEIIEADLASEIELKLPHLSTDVVGVNLKRKHIFMGKWVRYGGRYPLVMLRLFRHGHGRVENRWMDEHIVVSEGRTTTFDGGFADHNLRDLTYFIQKHNAYATREAIEVLNQRLNLFPPCAQVTALNSSSQVSTKRWIKESIYNQIPFTLSALLYFLYRYVIGLGFLDGRTGLIYHYLQGYWYRFLVGAKVHELTTAVSELSSREEIMAELSQRTGLPLIPSTNAPDTPKSLLSPLNITELEGQYIPS
jgi:glycosyltransferase involved in cell wall biosynthesis